MLREDILLRNGEGVEPSILIVRLAEEYDRSIMKMLGFLRGKKRA